MDHNDLGEEDVAEQDVVWDDREERSPAVAGGGDLLATRRDPDVWDDPQGSVRGHGQVIDARAWSPEPEREQVRGRLIMLLVLLVAVVTVWALILISAHYTAEAINLALTGLFTPALTTLGVGIGFYFGEKVGASKNS